MIKTVLETFRCTWQGVVIFQTVVQQSTLDPLFVATGQLQCDIKVQFFMKKISRLISLSSRESNHLQLSLKQLELATLHNMEIFLDGT